MTVIPGRAVTVIRTIVVLDTRQQGTMATDVRCISDNGSISLIHCHYDAPNPSGDKMSFDSTLV